MPQTHSFVFSPIDVQVLRQALTDPRPEVRRKAEALLQVAEGASKVSVARNVSTRSKTSIYNWIAQYRDGGIDGLARRLRQGRPRLATPDYQALLAVITDMEPREFGIDLDGWTADALNNLLEAKTGIAISDARFRVLLHTLGYQFQLVRPPRPIPMPRPKMMEELKRWLEAAQAMPLRDKRTWRKTPTH